MKRLIAAVTLCITGLLLSFPSVAQTDVVDPISQGSTYPPYFLPRAKNLARQAAIQENGGLNRYRPELSMYGPALEAPFERNPDGSVSFNFFGGAPGSREWDTVTTVRVAPDATVDILFNGPAPAGVGSGKLYYQEDQSLLKVLQEGSFLTRAQNLARQAGIHENGGLSRYRPEIAMFGPADESPHFRNVDDSITFRFKGGDPLAASPTLETWVTVTRQGQTTVDYNGPLLD
ncbi:purine nucleoside permease [Lyngbya confervoides]|uniref:Uncharacterized protein n=1 Tax=Lyngbya confervoides BDU141951 TaxID=1574623 RepID=A0ABD4SYT0_9CYAN|nr:purine nucleoside permease [Lyngbya confervoides]MCM1981434.1 hypothetical protein [Lyngbya confervoides BDU141951]